MITIATVLRSGGPVYDERWVHALRVGVAEYLKAPHRFVCLSDAGVEGVEVVPLAHGFPGWWSKVELFRPGVFDGRVLYMDLDTLPVGWLLDLTTYDGTLAVLSDFYQPEIMASGVMMFTPGGHTEGIYEAFMQDPAGITARHRSRSDYWYAKYMDQPDRIQDLFPRQVVSLKAHARSRVPKGARLVCGHGDPRLSHPDAGWAHDVWASRVEAGAPA